MSSPPIRKRLQELFEGFSPETLKALPARTKGLEITQVTSDSREVREGSLFVATRGETRDGHEFITQVASQGVSRHQAEALGRDRVRCDGVHESLPRASGFSPRHGRLLPGQENSFY